MPKYQYVRRNLIVGVIALFGFLFPVLAFSTAIISPKVLEIDLGERIDQMENIIPVMERNRTIEIALPYFNRFPQFTEELLGRAVRYFPVIERILKKYNLPDDLKYIPFFESGFREDAVSPVGAGGLWQFMEGTGEKYGLTINREIDERMDFVKSTEAAARFLKTLHEELDSWALALMAYNGGLYRVKRLIKENNTTDVQVIMNQMPQESQIYLSKMIAAKLIFMSYKFYGLTPLFPDPVDFYTIHTTYHSSIDLSAISSEYKVNYSALRLANPHLNYRKIRNAGHHTINIRIPLYAYETENGDMFRNQAFYISSEEQLAQLASTLQVSSRKIELVNEFFDPVNLTGQIIHLKVPLDHYMEVDKKFGPPPVNVLRKDIPLISSTNIVSRITSPFAGLNLELSTRKMYYLKPSESLMEVASRLNIPVEKLKNMNPDMDLYRSRRFYIPATQTNGQVVVSAF